MIEYVAIITLILLSGSIWGWSNPYVALFNLVSVLILFVQKSFKSRSILSGKNNLICFFIVAMVYTLNMVVVSRINPLAAWNVYTVIFSAFIICETVLKKDLISKYINIIVVMAVLSLFFWTLSRFGIVIADRIVDPGNGKIYRMNLFYIYRDSKIVIESGLNARNFGIFWEGGAYQAFLNLAVLLLVVFKRNMDKSKKMYWIKMGILVCTILTTFSTVGYILLIVNMFLFVLKNTSRKTKKRYGIIALVLMIGVVVINTPAVSEKFNSSSNSYVSYLIRMNDQISGIKAAMVSPIFGLGFNSKRYSEVLYGYGIYANSSGLLILAQQFGLVFALWYTLIQLKNFCGFCATKNWGQRILEIFFLVLIFSTENINQNGVFLLFLFCFKDGIESEDIGSNRNELTFNVIN